MSYEPMVDPSFSIIFDRIKNLNIVIDSRLVTPGSVFIAIPCPEIQRHCQEALEKGAVLVITNQESDVKPFVFIENPRLFWSYVSSHLYPKQPRYNVAVTGTNGKTSVVEFVRQLFLGLGIQSASLGTLGLRGLEIEETLPSLTTLDAFSLHKTLHILSEKYAVEAVASEASSHGLAQHRLHHLRLTSAGFTNLTHDHLDYHKTLEDYFAAKALLFSEILPAQGVAVLNQDTLYFSRLLEHVKHCSYISYGRSQGDLYYKSYRRCPEGFRVTLNVALDQEILFPVFGEFQLDNLLCALGLVLGCSVEAHRLIPIISKLQAPLGRLDRVRFFPEKNASVFIDYAHTPDALKNALISLRPLTQGKLWVIFGCGGDRDAAKREPMGEIAQEFADQVVVTDDNPRFEDPADIRKMILKGCPGADEIADRTAAIQETLRNLDMGDTLLIAGKGHETGQSIKGEIREFSDYKVKM